MNKKTWTVIGGLAVIAVLAAAIYQATALTGQQQGNPGSLTTPGANTADRRQVPAGGILPPTQQPARLPDLNVYEVVEVKDQSIFVKPFVKGPDDQGFPRTEIVTLNTTEIYHEATDWDHAGVNDQVQRVWVSYPLDQIKVGDTVDAWGDQRGDRLIAATIIVH